jgi:hypothetical protein
LRESILGMHTKMLVHHRVVLNPIQIYVKAQMMRSYQMKIRKVENPLSRPSTATGTQ